METKRVYSLIFKQIFVGLWHLMTVIKLLKGCHLKYSFPLLKRKKQNKTNPTPQTRFNSSICN